MRFASTSIAVRGSRLLRIHLQMAVLRSRNLVIKTSATTPGGPVVSLTSHGPRIKSVSISIESLTRGSLRPSRLILWLDEGDYHRPRPRALRRLMARGVEVLPSQNFGPHTKYFPYVCSRADHVDPLVTIDDDVIYPKWWLDALVVAYEKSPDVIHAMKVRRIEVADGRLSPYDTWGPIRHSRPERRNFALGVSGVIYPPLFLNVLRDAGDAFLASCPRGDDLWLHAMALRSGTRVAQASPIPRDFSTVRGTADSALMRVNVEQGGNDLQISRLYTAEDVSLL
jgi:hypothetical protein